MGPYALATTTWRTQGRRDVLQGGGRTLGHVELLQGSHATVATVYDRAGRRHQRPFWDRTEAKNWVQENAAV